MFPKVPQSSLGVLKVFQLPPPLEHPPFRTLQTLLTNPLTFTLQDMVHNEVYHPDSCANVSSGYEGAAWQKDLGPQLFLRHVLKKGPS